MQTNSSTAKITNYRVLGVFTLSLMGIAAIFSLRNLPIVAFYGLSSITFYLIALLVFFIPTALISARLGSEFPKAGGLYLWVSEIVGPRVGFVTIWLEWVNTVIAFPMMIAFIIFNIITLFSPMLADNRIFEFTFFLTIFWGITGINFFGLKTSSRFGGVLAMLGTLLPAFLIIILGGIWFFAGRSSHLEFSAHNLMPSLQLNHLAFLISVINGFSGIQVLAFHVRETKNATSTYTKASILTVSIILLMAIFATLAIALVMPPQALSVIGGLVATFRIFLTPFHLAWLTPLIAILIALGVLAELNAWLIGPSKGIFTAAEKGQLPKILASKNKHDMPTGVLILQGIVGSILGLAYLLMPSVSGAYWLLSDLTGQFTLLMWLVVFSSAIYLFYQRIQQNKQRVLNMLTILFAILGFVTCFAIYIVSYFPPSVIIQQNTVMRYEIFLIFGLLGFILLPLVGLIYGKKLQFSSE